MRADARRNRVRILAAAEAVFAERGPAASTEEVARRAGVAVGTVFRHFPTKQALLQAIMKQLRDRLADQAETLAADADPATALFTFFTSLVEQAAATRTVVEALSHSGLDLDVAESVQPLRESIGRLLTNAQQAGAVAPTIELDEVIALLAATTQATLRSAWSPALQQRTLAIIFAGLRSLMTTS
jgi:AcrR family transcriptional regulator